MKKDISRCYRMLHQELELKMPVVDPISNVLQELLKQFEYHNTRKNQRYAD